MYILNYYVKVQVANLDDAIEFAYTLSKHKVFQKLSYDEKLKILFSYPFRLETLY